MKKIKTMMAMILALLSGLALGTCAYKAYEDNLYWIEVEQKFAKAAEESYRSEFYHILSHSEEMVFDTNIFGIREKESATARILCTAWQMGTELECELILTVDEEDGVHTLLHHDFRN